MLQWTSNKLHHGKKHKPIIYKNSAEKSLLKSLSLFPLHINDTLSDATGEML